MREDHGELGTRGSGRGKTPLPHLKQETSVFSQDEWRHMRTRLLSNVDVKLPENPAQQQSSGPRLPPISAGLIFVSSPIRAGASRKFPELSRAGPLTWIHPLDDFFIFFLQEETGRREYRGARLVVFFASVLRNRELC